MDPRPEGPATPSERGLRRRTATGTAQSEPSADPLDDVAQLPVQGDGAVQCPVLRQPDGLHRDRRNIRPRPTELGALVAWRRRLGRRGRLHAAAQAMAGRTARLAGGGDNGRSAAGDRSMAKAPRFPRDRLFLIDLAIAPDEALHERRPQARLHAGNAQAVGRPAIAGLERVKLADRPVEGV